MQFTDRSEAGKLLAEKLKKYNGKSAIVYALPRGGVVTAVEIAKFLRTPIDLVIVRKIGHPTDPEFAIAAVSSLGEVVGNKDELELVDPSWFQNEVLNAKREIERRRSVYLPDKKRMSCQGKIAILVDDGVATGLTLRAGISELRHQNPKKLVVAVPVIPKSVTRLVKKEADELAALIEPSDEDFLNSVSAYYEQFDQVDDGKVIGILYEYDV